MFHPALWKLIRFQWRGNFRQFRRSLGTFRGIFQAAFMLALALYGVVSLYLATRFTAQSAPLANMFDQFQSEILPVGLLGYTCYVLLFSTGEATVYFTASEVAFLFPAPITRKQLLSYLLLKSAMGMAALSVFFALFSTTKLSMAAPRCLAVMLTLVFLQLITMNVAFSRQIMKVKLNALVRQILGCVIGGLVIVAVLQTSRTVTGGDVTAYLNAFKGTSVGGVLLAPFQVFVRALRADTWLAFLPNVALLILLDAALLLLVFRLDALSLEAAVSISEKMTERIKALQTKGIWHAFGPSNSAVARRRIPVFPFWKGIGPILWQRLTTTFRSSTSMLWILGGALAAATGLVYLMGTSNTEATRNFGAPIAGVGAMAYLSFLICLTLQNDIERVGYLKSLPIRPVSIVIGDLIGFPLIVSFVQIVFISVLACFYPALSVWLLGGALLTLPLNFLLFAIDKLIFYVYPTKMAKGAPGDFQNSGKQIIFIGLKMVLLGVAALIVVLAAIPGGVALQSPVAAAASAGFVLLLECMAVIPLLIMAYDRFDPSVTLVQ